MVTRHDLIAAVRQGRVISDWAISGAIKAVRVAPGDTAKQKWIFRTVHGRGFRFVAEIISNTPEHLLAARLIVLIRVFRPAESDPDLDYLCDGPTEDLIDGLSRIEGLTVLSCNAARALGREVPGSGSACRRATVTDRSGASGST